MGRIRRAWVRAWRRLTGRRAYEKAAAAKPLYIETQGLVDLVLLLMDWKDEAKVSTIEASHRVRIRHEPSGRWIGIEAHSQLRLQVFAGYITDGVLGDPLVRIGPVRLDGATAVEVAGQMDDLLREVWEQAKTAAAAGPE